MSYLTDGFDNEVVDLLRRGRAGLLPTDTIYGLSCRALDEKAVESLYEIKGRDSGKPFIVLISDIKMLDLLSIPSGRAQPIKSYWPGALSVIFASDAPEYLTRGTGSLAVRLPEYPHLRRLIDKSGPLVSTSANLSGGQPARNAQEAEKYFGDRLDFYVDAGMLENPPSTVVSVKDNELKILRQGSLIINT